MWPNCTSSTRAGNQLYPRLSNHFNHKQHVLFAQIATSDSQEQMSPRSNFFISKSKLHIHSIMNVNKQTLKKAQQTQGLCPFTKVTGFCLCHILSFSPILIKIQLHTDFILTILTKLQLSQEFTKIALVRLSSNTEKPTSPTRVT